MTIDTCPHVKWFTCINYFAISTEGELIPFNKTCCRCGITRDYDEETDPKLQNCEELLAHQPHGKNP